MVSGYTVPSILSIGKRLILAEPPKPPVSKRQNSDELEEVRFTLRAPQFVFSQVDAARRSRSGFVSRNTWILEAITERLERELLGRPS